MKRLGFFTASRAEFGLIAPLIHRIEDSPILDYVLFAGGTHLSDSHGNTLDEIEKEGFSISAIFNYLSTQTTSSDILKSLGKEIYELATIFEEFEFDAVCLLGDRYELLPIALAAILHNKAIIHIHGGEKSEGVIDEQVRHMITKAAHIHFPACDDYALNICKMGEEKWRIFNTGSLAVDNISRIPKIPKMNLFNDLQLNQSNELILLTFHPVTLKQETSSIKQLQHIFDALKYFKFQVLITAPNMEVDRNLLVNEIYEKVEANSNYFYIESLGVKKYLNLIPHCKFVIGNSSSGIIEIPYFKIPTINIGDRQKGRIRHRSVIDTGYSPESIRGAIEQAIDEDFINSLSEMEYKFGDGNAANKMVEFLESVPFNRALFQKQLDFTC